jgi:glycosyltransferase involved in cell wall biosynthesis
MNMALVDVLVPTCGRKTGLAVVLTSLMGQTFTDFDVIISDQTGDAQSYLQSIEIDTLVRTLRWRGHRVTLHRHLPQRGMGEQRQFLLDQSQSRYVYFVDDDVLLDPMVLQRLLAVIEHEDCGFVGTAATGPSFLDDIRPDEQQIELWDGPVRAEPFAPDSIPWERHRVNNAANPLHLEQRLVRDGETVRYKVAWVGGASVLYDRAKLVNEGGFSWWNRLPPEHAGEDALAQFLLIRDYGGCAILPSGTYHLGLPTTITNRQCNATELFERILAEREEDSLMNARNRRLFSFESLIPMEITR